MHDFMASPGAHEKQVRRVLLIEGCGNAAVILIKVFVGLASGSFAILGDALHSLTDLANNLVAWIVVGASNKPPDRDHPYGHRKFETLAVFVLATLLTVLAIELVLGALRREQPILTDLRWGIFFMIGVLVINVALAIWQDRWARRLDSEILRADARHTFADAITTVGVIISWQLSLRGFVWLDTVCTFGVAAFVFYLALTLFKRVVPVLVDHVAIDPEETSAAVLAVPGVCSVRRVRSRMNGNRRTVDLVITVAAHLTTAESHQIADSVEKVLENEFEAHDVTIHIEPDDPEHRGDLFLE